MSFKALKKQVLAILAEQETDDTLPKVFLVDYDESEPILARPTDLVFRVLPEKEPAPKVINNHCGCCQWYKHANCKCGLYEKRMDPWQLMFKCHKFEPLEKCGACGNWVYEGYEYCSGNTVAAYTHAGTCKLSGELLAFNCGCEDWEPQ